MYEVLEAGPEKADATAPAGSNVGVSDTEIRIRGRAVRVAATEIDNRTIVVTGHRLKIATVRDEDLWEGETVSEPQSFISRLKKSGLRADVFTFAQRIPDTTQRYEFRTEWDNEATLAITSYEHWWKECTEYSIRKAVNKAKKVGVTAERAEFNDDFVRSICRIYGESPARQGRAFWHYKKDFDTVKHELGTYLDRSVFIGAYHENELIGSLKMTYVGPTATIMQIFCSQNHFDKRPNNALLAKAVEICVEDGKGYLIYGNFTYRDVDTSLTEFKRRNGFEPVLLPRYYVPLTLKGALALKLGLHHGILGCVPPSLLKRARDIRAKWYARRSKQAPQTQG
jgi:hypothetical protein